MKLLIITPAVNKQNQALGFFHRWIELFAQRCKQVTVLTLEVGVHDLPHNVKVIHLGDGNIERAKNLIVQSFKLRKEYDHVFVHMGQIFILTAGWLWKILGKKIVFWYTHPAVTTSLKIATWFSDAIVTAAKESFRIKSPKVHIIGHGIDLNIFTRGTQLPPEQGEYWNFLSVGRITKIKEVALMIETIFMLKEKGERVKLTLVGKPVTQDDVMYQTELQKLIDSLQLSDYVSFAGAMPNDLTFRAFQKAHIHLNFCQTGSFDKAIIEGMACGAVPFVRNKAFATHFGARAHHWINSSKSPGELADQIRLLLKASVWMDDHQASVKLARQFDLHKLIDRILGML